MISRRRVLAVAVAALAGPTVGAFGGTGQYRTLPNGTHALDFGVSIRFDATQQQINRIISVLIGGSFVLADATDGQVRFGRVKLFNNEEGGAEAEIWIHEEEGVAYTNNWGGWYGQAGGRISQYAAAADHGSGGPLLAWRTLLHERPRHKRSKPRTPNPEPRTLL